MTFPLVFSLDSSLQLLVSSATITCILLHDLVVSNFPGLPSSRKDWLLASKSQYTFWQGGQGVCLHAFFFFVVKLQHIQSISYHCCTHDISDSGRVGLLSVMIVSLQELQLCLGPLKYHKSLSIVCFCSKSQPIHCEVCRLASSLLLRAKNGVPQIKILD